MRWRKGRRQRKAGLASEIGTATDFRSMKVLQADPAEQFQDVDGIDFQRNRFVGELLGSRIAGGTAVSQAGQPVNWK